MGYHMIAKLVKEQRENYFNAIQMNTGVEEAKVRYSNTLINYGEYIIRGFNEIAAMEDRINELEEEVAALETALLNATQDKISKKPTKAKTEPASE